MRPLDEETSVIPLPTIENRVSKLEKIIEILQCDIRALRAMANKEDEG
jgi:hypothetical protein